jgi:hypothetical protein
MRISKLLVFVGTIATLTVLLVFSSCAGRENAEAVKTDDKSVTTEGKGFRKDLTGTAEWPPDMFEGVPKFTFGKILRVSKGEEGGMMKFNIFFRDMEQGGIEKYMELLKESGWKANLNAAGGPGGMVTGEKEGLGMNLVFSTEDRTGMLAVFSVKQE